MRRDAKIEMVKWFPLNIYPFTCISLDKTFLCEQIGQGLNNSEMLKDILHQDTVYTLRCNFHAVMY